jgi:hypothetical protein
MNEMVLLLLVFLPFTLFSQNGVLPISEETGKITYQSVVQVDGTSKNDLYKRGKTWFINTFSSSENVIEYEDKEEGIIMGKGLFPVKANMVSAGHVRFTIKIEFKDGRYRYTLTDFWHTGEYDSSYDSNTVGDLKEEKPGGFMGGMGKRAWNKIKEQTNFHATQMLASLKEKMDAKAANDDW